MLVNMRDLLADARVGGYAVGSFSVANMEMVLGVLQAAEELRAPVILQIAEVRLRQSPLELIGPLMVAAARQASVPVAVHFDHGKTEKKIGQALELGFTSVMFDGSHLPLDENIAETCRIIEMARPYGAAVEAEIGCVGGSEDGSEEIAMHCTNQADAVRFEQETGVDALAIAIGTSHGAYKFKPEQCTRNEQGILVPPPLRFDVLKEVSRRLPGFPIVLHGSSSVPQEYVKMINDHGGRMPNAIGVPEEQLREAAKLSVCKINIDSDLRLAMTGTIRQFMEEHPDKFDPREYLKPARANIKELVRHKLVDVLGCAGKA